MQPKPRPEGIEEMAATVSKGVGAAAGTSLGNRNIYSLTACKALVAPMSLLGSASAIEAIPDPVQYPARLPPTLFHPLPAFLVLHSIVFPTLRPSADGPWPLCLL